jgi:hypothetical protein
VTVTAKRWSLLGLRQVQKFIPSPEISDVYREGSAVQVHLRGARNAYFRMWAEDAARAAQLVAVLPTRHTIEFDSEFSASQAVPAGRVPVVFLIAVLAVATAAGIALWLSSDRHRSQSRSPTLPGIASPLAPLAKGPAALPANSAAVHADVLLAQRDLAQFGPRIETLTTEFSAALDALMDGRVSQQKFADELEQWLLPQWDDLEARVRRTNAAPDSRQQKADGELMATINNWQLAVRSYVEDLRNHRRVDRAFAYMGRAEAHQRRAEQIQSDLESPAP